jgi:valyl-tRNA synthetase
MKTIIEVIHSIRNARAQHKVESNKWITAQIYAGELTAAITPYSETIQTLARAKPVTFHEGKPASKPQENALVLVLQGAEVVIPMESMVDLDTERGRLQEEKEHLESEVTRLEARLKEKNFLTKAPAAVVEKERERLAARKTKLARLTEQLEKRG